MAATASSSGTSSTLASAALTQYFPVAQGLGNEQWMPWVYGSSGSTTPADSANRGLYRRAISWDGVSIMTFATTWPTAITTGTYEIYAREDPTRIIEAINEAVGQLGLWWYREFVDTSITTATQTWQYTMPATQYTARINQVEYQVDTNAADIGFPYADAQWLNWELREATDTTGTLTQVLQFAILPPPSRTLRVRGEAYYPDLANDTDTLALSGKWERPCLAWVYAYATHLMQQWMSNLLPQGDVKRFIEQEKSLLASAETLRHEMMRSHKPGRIIVPGKGTGLFGHPNAANSPYFLAGFHAAGN